MLRGFSNNQVAKVRQNGPCSFSTQSDHGIARMAGRLVFIVCRSCNQFGYDSCQLGDSVRWVCFSYCRCFDLLWQRRPWLLYQERYSSATRLSRSQFLYVVTRNSRVHSAVRGRRFRSASSTDFGEMMATDGQTVNRSTAADRNHHAASYRTELTVLLSGSLASVDSDWRRSDILI